MDFANATALDSRRLAALLLRHTAPYRHDDMVVRVRYSRGADFSGSCHYQRHLIYVNLGRHVTYPYALATHVARARGNRAYWWRELYVLTVADAYQLVLFVYLHELYHYLLKQSGRGLRQREAMCDRFAAGVLVDEHAASLKTRQGRPVSRKSWDFQDLRGFVAAAPRSPPAVAATRAIPVTIRGRES